MPERAGLEHTIAHAELPRLKMIRGGQLNLTRGLSVPLQERIAELARRMEAIEEALDRGAEQYLEYLKREQVSLSAAIDLLARGINERSLDLACYFFLDNVGANLTDQALSNGMSTRGFAAEDFGSITSITVTSNAARTAGTLTVEAVVTDRDDATTAKSGFTAVLDATNTRTNTARQDPGTDTFEEGDLLGVYITTASFAPTTADIDVCLGIRYTGRTR